MDVGPKDYDHEMGQPQWHLSCVILFLQHPSNDRIIEKETILLVARA